jgi:general secretion pathway protein D
VDVTVFEAIPTAFETRNVGVTLEVEPVLEKDGNTITLSLVPQHVRLKGFNKITIEKPATGGKIVVEQPEFVTKKVTTSLQMRDGQRMLIGIYPTDEPPKHTELFVIKASVVR